MKKILPCFLLCLTQLTANSQDLPSPKSGSPRLKLYIDCGQGNCDFNYIRQQIPVAGFVRDRKESDIHILITSHSSANGGQKYDILFLGQNRWLQKNDTLHFFTAPNSSDDNTRKQLVKFIQAGIVPYLVKSGEIDKLNFFFEKDSVDVTTAATSDKWNNWVFSIGGRARLSGDKNYKVKDLSVNGTAGRVTEKSKLEFSFFHSTAQNSYPVDNGDKLKTINNYVEAEQEYVKSISSKWSWAVETSYRKSSYNNMKSSYSAAAGMEYNIFPYSVSSSKFFVLRSMIEVTKRNYIEETIFDKLKETLFSFNLGTYVYFTQPWGSISSGITWYNYLHDLSKNKLSMDAVLSLKLFKGVSINFHGNASFINDQLSLARQGASTQEALLRLKALATNFNYYTGIGINYRFGSQFNNFVNPRFTDGRY